MFFKIWSISSSDLSTNFSSMLKSLKKLSRNAIFSKILTIKFTSNGEIIVPNYLRDLFNCLEAVKSMINHNSITSLWSLIIAFLVC